MSPEELERYARHILLREIGAPFELKLVQRTEAEMHKTKNFGRKSLDEITRVLGEMGLDFGMKLEGFDKKYQEWKRLHQNEA